MPNIRIFMATDVNQLIDEMQLKRDSLFQKHTFVTQTTGINHYLKMQLAQRYGVVSNLEFLSPNELIMNIASKMGAMNTAAYSTENIRWRLFKLLDSAEFLEKFPFMSAYLQSDELKRIQLATKLADLFDQYLVFRTDMMKSWTDQKIEAIDKNTNESWQKWLWKAIKAQLSENILDKLAYKEEFIAKIKSQDQALFAVIRQQFQEVHVFGLTVLTKFHLELLWSLSAIVKVNFYFLNPCVSDFWYDCYSEKDFVKKWSWHKNRNEIDSYSSGNELLTSLGKVSQELFVQLFNLDDDVFSYLEYQEKEYKPHTLLQYLQHDIHLNIRPDSRQIFDNQLVCDGSLKINSNYTEAREVEVLYDYLLNLIDNHYKGDLQPHDIVVLLPNVEQYVPFIKSVFDHAPKKIPYSIGDRPVNQSQSLLTVCLDILNLYTQEFSSEDVIQLLDYQIIKNRFSIQDVDLIRSLLRDANIRFGIYGNKDLETNLVSWELGLSKLFFSIFAKDQGIAIDGEDFNVLPQVEGTNVVQEVLNFVAFVRKLMAHASVAKHDRSLGDWNDYFLNLLHLFVGEDEEEENNELTAIVKKIDSLSVINKNLEGITLSFETYLYIIKSYHSNETTNDGYFKGRITFCQALPMRSIPFKVLAFLGLNAKDFPRKDVEYAFDLIKMGFEDNGKRKLGDRSTKENDKYLFLEALLSAQDFFYMSYLGQSIKNNKDLNPSSVIQELLDYLQKYSKSTAGNLIDIRAVLVQKHPMRSDSKLYLRDKNYFTYLGETKKVAFKKYMSQPVLEESKQCIDFEDILKFYKDPITYYYQKILGIYTNEENLLLPEEEVFEIKNGLDSYNIRKYLLTLPNIDFDFLQSKLKKEGVLPLGNVGKYTLETNIELVQETRIEYLKLVDSQLNENRYFEIELENILFKINLKDVFDNLLVRINYSKKERIYKSDFSYYLEYLAANYTSQQLPMCVLGIYSPIKTIAKDAMAHTDLRLEFENLIRFYLQHKTQLIPFQPNICIKVSTEKTLKTELDKESKYNTFIQGSQERGLWNDVENVQNIARQLMSNYNQWFSK